MNSMLSMRPFQIILLVVFGLFAAIGLYLFANYTGMSGANKIGTVVIWGTLPQETLTREINNLSVSNKSFGKVSYSQKSARTFDADLADAIASGNGPDLILINQEQLISEKNKLSEIPFSSISQRSFLNTYLSENQLYLTSTGTYGIPFVLDPLVLYYNKNMLASAGIPLPPRTWEAVTGLAPSLSHVSSGGLAQAAISFGQYQNVENARAILSLLFLQAGNPISDSSSGGLRSALGQQSSQVSGIPPAQSVINFFTQFSDPSRIVYSWNASFESARLAFLSGTVAMYVGFASEQPQLSAANPNLAFDMASIPQPQTASQKIDYGLAYAFAIPKASGNAKGAYATALALTSANVLPSTAAALSMAPSQPALLAPSANDTYAPVYFPMALVARGWLSPAPSTVDSIFGAMISNVTSGRQDSAAAVSQADQALSAALPSN